MKIIPVECPKCGAGFDIEEGRKTCFCQYCGTKIAVDDGINRTVNTSIIRDEAKIKELELREKQLELEVEKERLKQKDRKKNFVVNAILISLGLFIVTIGYNTNNSSILVAGFIAVLAPIVATIIRSILE